MKLINYSGCLIAALVLCYSIKGNSDSVTIKVHFLHGSKPKAAYKYTEDRWFGGILGGHAGIEFEPNQIINFLPRSGVHLFSKPKIINSKFSIHDTTSFYAIMSGKIDTVKSTIVYIRISDTQKNKLDSIVAGYRKRAPYDYAFFGMRCGAAAAEILGQIGVLKKTGLRHTWMHTFYPRKLRRRLEHDASLRNYLIVKSEGNRRRKWEKD